MKYKVTGGQDGVSGIDVGQRRYEAGETVDMPASKAEWLLECGYLAPLDAKSVSNTAGDSDQVATEEETE